MGNQWPEALSSGLSGITNGLIKRQYYNNIYKQKQRELEMELEKLGYARKKDKIENLFNIAKEQGNLSTLPPRVRQELFSAAGLPPDTTLPTPDESNIIRTRELKNFYDSLPEDQKDFYLSRLFSGAKNSEEMYAQMHTLDPDRAVQLRRRIDPSETSEGLQTDVASTGIQPVGKETYEQMLEDIKTKIEGIKAQTKYDLAKAAGEEVTTGIKRAHGDDAARENINYTKARTNLTEQTADLFGYGKLLEQSKVITNSYNESIKYLLEEKENFIKHNDYASVPAPSEKATPTYKKNWYEAQDRIKNFDERLAALRTNVAAHEAFIAEMQRKTNAFLPVQQQLTTPKTADEIINILETSGILSREQ